MNPLYEMKLGDCLYDSQCHRNYVRVPGGWVVESGNATDVTSSCFVPFHNEFMECSEQGEPSFNSPASPAQHRKADKPLCGKFTKCKSHSKMAYCGGVGSGAVSQFGCYRKPAARSAVA